VLPTWGRKAAVRDLFNERKKTRGPHLLVVDVPSPEGGARSSIGICNISGGKETADCESGSVSKLPAMSGVAGLQRARGNAARFTKHKETGPPGESGENILFSHVTLSRHATPRRHDREKFLSSKKEKKRRVDRALRRKSYKNKRRRRKNRPATRSALRQEEGNWGTAHLRGGKTGREKL